MIKELFEKTLKIDFPVFGYTLNVVLTNCIDISRNKINNKVGVPESRFDDCSGLHSYNKNDSEGFVFITASSPAGTIAHESSHAIYRMFTFYGVGFDDEAFAYHLGFVVDKVTAFMIKNKKQVK